MAFPKIKEEIKQDNLYPIKYHINKTHKIDNTIDMKSFIEDKQFISISKSIMDILLKHKDYIRLVTLYSFIYGEGIKQKTNQPYVTSSYCAKGLNWSVRKVQGVKTVLFDIGLITTVSDKHIPSYRYKKHYTHIKYMWSKDKISEFLHSNRGQNIKNNNLPVLFNINDFNILMKQSKVRVEDLIGLYLFYLYCSNWQQNCLVRAIIPYINKKLNWGRDRARRVRQYLIRLNLIEDKILVSDKTKKRGFVMVKKSIFSNKTNKIQPTPTGFDVVEFLRISALNNNTYTLNNNNIFLYKYKNNNFSPKQKKIDSGGLSLVSGKKTRSPEYNKKQGKITHSEDYVNYWNSLNGVRKHKFGTNSYTKANKLLQELEVGVFDDNHILPDIFKEKFKIPSKINNIPSDKIKTTLDNLALITNKTHIPNGFGPEFNHELFPKNLSELIYNPRAPKLYSWFLYILFNGVKKVNADGESIVISKYPEIIKEVKKSIGGSPNADLSDVDMKKLILNLDEMILYYENLSQDFSIRDNKVRIVYWGYTEPLRMIRRYIDWLSYQDYLDKITISMFNPGGKLFNNFIKQTEAENGIRISKYGE